MNSKFLFLVLIILTTFLSTAQDHLIGIQGGLNLTNVSALEAPGKAPRMGVAAGITYEYSIKDKFSFGAGFIFAQRGYKSGLAFTDENGELSKNDFQTQQNYEYYSFPIKMGYKFGNKFFGFINAAGVPAFLTDAQTIVPGFNGGQETTIDFTRQAEKYDFSGMLELGCGYKVQDKTWIFASTSFQHSFTNAAKTTFSPNTKIYHNGLTFSLGVKFKLAN